MMLRLIGAGRQRTRATSREIALAPRSECEHWYGDARACLIASRGREGADPLRAAHVAVVPSEPLSPADTAETLDPKARGQRAEVQS